MAGACVVNGEILKRKDYLRNLGVHGRIILNFIFNVREWTGFIWLRIRISGGIL
jgi:hypothetical protein